MPGTVLSPLCSETSGLPRDPIRQLLFSNHYTEGETETNGVESLAQNDTAGEEEKQPPARACLPQLGTLHCAAYHKME